ncbi:MAG: hypothetical protein ACRDRT_11510, partial [Pseudonocardiaceae bacterium]
PTEVIGFHGTNHAAVPHLLAGDIGQSDEHFEWLGSGFYLWQDSPWRAQEWAVDRFGDDAAVVVARVSLDSCLDLLNPRWHEVIADADGRYVNNCLNQGRTPALNRPSGNRARDCAVINWYCDRSAQEGLRIRSVRAIFEEGEPIFEASAIRALSHTQIAVRDPSVILEIEELQW